MMLFCLKPHILTRVELHSEPQQVLLGRGHLPSSCGSLLQSPQLWSLRVKGIAVPGTSALAHLVKEHVLPWVYGDRPPWVPASVCLGPRLSAEPHPLPWLEALLPLATLLVHFTSSGPLELLLPSVHPPLGSLPESQQSLRDKNTQWILEESVWKLRRS